MPKKARLHDVFDLSKRLPRADRLRPVSLLSGDLPSEIDRDEPPVDILSLAGVGRNVWREIDVDAYLRQERASRES